MRIRRAGCSSLKTVLLALLTITEIKRGKVLYKDSDTTDIGMFDLLQRG